MGHSCFRFKGKQVILVTDPYDPSIGFKLRKVTAEIVTISHNHYDHNNTSAVLGTPQRKKPFVIAGPGEYEIADVFILGLVSFHDRSRGKERGKNTIYIIKMDDIRLVHLGDLGVELNDKQLEEINGADILFVPVGGTYTLNAKEAAAVVAQVEPKIVIPMHYRLPGLKIDLAPVDEFLTEMGIQGLKRVPKLIISKEKLPEERETVVLDARG